MSPARRAICLAMLIAAFPPARACLGQVAPADDRIVVSKVSEVCRIDIEGGLLKLSSPLKDTPLGETRNVWISEISCDGTIFVSHDLAGGISCFQLILNHTVDGQPVVDSIYAPDNTHLTISRTIDGDSPEQKRRISMAQTIWKPGDKQPTGPHSPLVFKVYDRSVPATKVLKTVRGDTFDEMIRADRDTIESDLRPIMQSLQLDALLGPSDLTMMQVFSDALPEDAAMTAKVNDLLPNLDSDSGPERDDATSQLRQLGLGAQFLLLKQNRAMLSTEQILRIDQICHRAPPLSADKIAQLKKDVKFLLDSMESTQRPIRLAAVEALRKTTGKDISFDVDADGKSITATCDKLRSELLPKDAKKAD